MKRIRSKRQRLCLLCLAIIVLSGGLYFLLPNLFQLPLLQENIYDFVSRQIPGEVTYRKEALTLFPSPTLHFYDVRLEVDGQYSGTIREVSATPHFFSLLRGRFNLAKLTFIGVECTAEIPAQAERLSLEMILGTLGQHLDTWAGMLAPVKQKRFTLGIKKSALTLTRAKEPLFSIQDMDVRVSWHRPVISFDMDCETALWDRGRLALEMDIATREISGRLTAKDLEIAPKADFTFAGTPFRLEEAALDADISWETGDFKTWRLAVEASNPALTVSNKSSRFNLEGKKAAGEAHISGGGIHASISELDLDTPDLRLTGRFDLDTEAPLFGWQVNVEQADLASTRTAALFFADRFKTTRIIAQVLREGGVKELTLGQKAGTPAELRKLSSFYLQGRLDGATVFVPKADLLLTESYGSVTVSDGILKAFDLETRLGNSRGNRGSFTMSLHNQKPRPWSVTCDIRADLAQLPPLLEQLTPGTALAREMAGIEAAEGSAEGSLVLDLSADGLQVALDVSEFDLSAAYHRIPYPVTLSGGKFSYGNHSIGVQGIRGAIGDSRFSDLSAGLHWKTDPLLDISAARAEIRADELADWLGDHFSGFKDVSGTPVYTGGVAVDQLQFSGPPDNPRAWQFQIGGSVPRRLTVRSPLLPEAVDVNGARFFATHEKIEIMDGDASILGSSLSVSGYLKGYLADTPRELDILAIGRLGPEISDWLTARAHIPEALRWQTPVNAVPIALHWEENERLDISGDAAFETGLRLSFDLEKAGSELTYGKFDLRHNQLHAAATLTRGGDGLGLRFTGSLSQDTLSTLLVENPWLKGNLSGDFNLQWDLKPPYLKSMTGHLQVDRLDFSPADLPLVIESAAITGNGGADIEAARFEWKSAGFETSGRVNRIGENLVLDLALAAERLDWPWIKALMDTATSPNAIGPFLYGDIRFSCDTLSLTDTLAFEPFAAHLELNGNRTDITFQQADACGISFPGTLTLTPEAMHFDFKPSAEQQDLEPTLGCLKKGKAFIDGRFDLTGDIAFQWNRSGSIWEAMEGSAALTAADGRIYKGGNLGKLFSMLNVSELLSGDFPDFEKEGFPYESSTFEGKFKSGVFELETGVIDGPAMKIFFEGSENLVDREHALTIVVAPLKTVDGMIGKIPLLSDVLEKGLVVYPVKVTGSWEDPQLALLSPTAVGGEVLGIMLRTLRTPVTIFEKILHDSKADPEKPNP